MRSSWTKAPLRLLAAASALAGASLLPSQATAKPAILVLELQVEGLPADLGRLFDDAMRKEVKAVRGRRAKLLPRPALDFDAMKLAAGCVDDGPDCLAVIGQTLGAAQVLQASISGDPARARVRFLLLDVKKNTKKESTGELTDLDEESTREFRVLVAAVFGVKKKPPAGSLALEVEAGGSIGGAEILLDDRRVGTDALAAVTPGRHRLEIRKPGYETFIWLGMVRPGRATKVVVELEASKPDVATPPIANAGSTNSGKQSGLPDGELDENKSPAGNTGTTVTKAPEPEEKGRGGRVVTWVLAGSAVAATVVGGVFAARVNSQESALLDMQQQISAQCEVDGNCGATVCDIDNPPSECSAGRTSAAVSIASFAAAGALAAGAIVMYFVEAPDEKDEKTSVEVAAGAAPMRDGAAAAVWLKF